ncbi:MAG TPA: hypothetical protein PLV42_12725 [bacterium]|nr:hypothetical protein [bacterium]
MIRLMAAMTLLLCGAALYGGSEVTAGAYVPLNETKPADPTAPGYYFLTGRALYEPAENFFIGGDIFFQHGFPENDMTNLVETSYLLGRGRLIMEYDWPKVKIGTVTYASLSDSSGDYSKLITEGLATLGGYRQEYIHQELYLSANPFAEFRMNAAVGVNSQSYDVASELGSGIIRDTNLFAFGEMSYRIFPALEPFAGLFYSDDLNEQDTFDLLRFRGGLRGEELFFDNRLHLAYALSYKREEAEPLTDKDRMALYLKGRWNFTTDTDLFGWFYHEYALAPMRYVNRYVALQVRQWLFDRKLALSAGSFLLIEKRPGNGWYLPVWPFFEIQSYPLIGLTLYGRVQLKCDELYQPSGKWEYDLFQTRLEVGGGYLIGGYVQPTVLFFMNLAEGPASPDSLGLKLLVTAFF